METRHVYDNYDISGCYRCKEDGKDVRQFVETCADAEAEAAGIPA